MKNLSMVAKFFSADCDIDVFGLDTPFGFFENGSGFKLKSLFKGCGNESCFEWPPRPLKNISSVFPGFLDSHRWFWLDANDPKRPVRPLELFLTNLIGFLNLKEIKPNPVLCSNISKNTHYRDSANDHTS